MKKFMIGGLAAICAAVGLSSYNTQDFAGTYLFKVNSGVNKTAGTAQTYTDADVIRVASAINQGCTTSSGFDCIVTFATSNLTQTNFSHLQSGNKIQRGTVSSRVSLP